MEQYRYHMLYQLSRKNIVHRTLWNENFWPTFTRIQTSDHPMLLSDNIPIDVYEFRALLFLSHTNNFVLFASWVCHQKVFQMQLLRSAFSGPISRALPKWELLSCLGEDWIIDIEDSLSMVELFKSLSGSSLGKDLKCIWNFEFKLQVYFKDYHEMCIFGIEDRLGSEPF